MVTFVQFKELKLVKILESYLMLLTIQNNELSFIWQIWDFASCRFAAIFPNCVFACSSGSLW